MTHQTRPTLHLPTAPYLVIEVGGPMSGMVVCDCQTHHAAQVALGKWRHSCPGQDYRVIEQRKQAA